MEEQVSQGVQVRNRMGLAELAAELQRLGILHTPPVAEVAARAEARRLRRRLHRAVTRAASRIRASRR